MKIERLAPAFVFGDNIDTDQIYPGCFLELVDPTEIGKHCFAGIDPDISPRFPAGGIVVAGRNFGCGSSREHAPIALLNMGATMVVAESFARIFYRNAINLGLPVVVCKGISKVVLDGQQLLVNLETGIITVKETDIVLQGEKLGDHAMHILSAGGIKPLMLQQTANMYSASN